MKNIKESPIKVDAKEVIVETLSILIDHFPQQTWQMIGWRGYSADNTREKREFGETAMLLLLRRIRYKLHSAHQQTELKIGRGIGLKIE